MLRSTQNIVFSFLHCFMKLAEIEPIRTRVHERTCTQRRGSADFYPKKAEILVFLLPGNVLQGALTVQEIGQLMVASQVR